MLMNSKTRESLDFDRVLQDLLPSSPFGVRCKNDMKPFMSSDAEKLARELDNVQRMKGLLDSKPEVIRELKGHLKQIKDIRRSVERCSNSGILNQVELFELKSLTFTMHSLRFHQDRLGWQMDEKYIIRELPKVLKILDPQDSGIRAFYIYDEYSEKLRDIRAAKAAKEQELELLRKKAIEDVEKQTGLKLKVTGEFTAGRNQHELVQLLSDCHALQLSSETLVNVTYKIRQNNEMAECRKEIASLKGAELLEEANVLQQISERLSEHSADILKNIDAIGQLDLLIAKAELALRHRAIKPQLTGDGSCIIKGGINPVVEKELCRTGGRYMPVSVGLSQGVTLITGANMGGKTVSLKMMGLLSAMAQYGMLVPAEYMSFQPFEFIYISCGDEQSVNLGLSTFGGEIKAVSEVLVRSDERGLLLLDELARGTNPKEGYAISYAIIAYLAGKPCVSVITTHLEGLEKPGVRHLQVKGLRNIDFGSIKDYHDLSQYMDYSLIEVSEHAAIPQDAIKISRIMGMPIEIINQAEAVMNRKSQKRRSRNEQTKPEPKHN